MDSHTTPPISPLIYQPGFEVPEEGEVETIAGMLETLRHISEVTYKDSGHATRSVHAKSHGLLHGKLTVAEGLPPAYAQGIFSKPGNWPVVMRLSTIPGDMLDDNVSTPRGMAVKIVGVEGPRLEDSEGDVTQDLALVNGSPSFATPGPKKFLGNLKLLAPTTDKAPGLKKALSAVLRGTEKVIEAVGGQSPLIIALGGHPETNILGESFFSQAPILFGPYMAKISIVPISSSLTQLTKAPVDLDGKPDGLREAVVDFFASNSAEWEVRAQLCTDLDKMPIEDASVPWPEDLSPYVTVARISAPPQAAWSAALSKAVDDDMSFSPWHGIAAHRPIGSIMRVRKAAYQMSSRFRAERNGAAMKEPADLDNLPR
ncbi:catalase family protein [Undibacterium terreum]|uniref:Catalase n=1 Tax=Undibacterium terreum TaxID=1224302 RepID=A0A916XDS1_9BURK|nr:catalase family protein [Undibacterium terreum]GGC63130.1 catalase [Undibacterium terreum]